MPLLPVQLAGRFTVRPPRHDDIPAIIELVMAMDLKHYGVADKYSPDDILQDWSGLDLQTDAWTVVTTDGRLAAYATITDEGSGHFTADGYVHPEFTGQGIGSQLVQLMEARAYELVPHAPAGARVALSNSVLQSDTAARSILEQASYHLVRTYWRMAIDLIQQPPAPAWPDGIALRTFRYGQERAIFDAVEESFQDHWGHVPRDFTEWVARIKLESFDPSLWFMAMDDSEIAGAILCRTRPDNSGWINTVAARRPWRNRGLGTALLHTAFGEFYRRNITHLALGVDSQNLTGATRLYERVGMHVSLRIASYEKQLRAGIELATTAL